jgi:alkylated DNA repair protein alkB family protein 6
MDLPSGHEGLEAFRIASLPPEFYYIPNFVTAEEEASILDKVSMHCDLS